MLPFFQFAFVATLCGVAVCAEASPIGPDPVLPSSLAVQITEAGQVGTPDARNNFASPVVVDGVLYVVDQRGTLYREGTAGFDAIAADPPAGVTPFGKTAIANISAGSAPGEIFVLYTSSTNPAGLVAPELPEGVSGECCDDGTQVSDLYDYNGTGPSYQVLARYTIGPSGLTDPDPIASFEVQGSGGAHRGGGMVTLPDGQVLLATGDSLPWGLNGLDAPQDDGSHLSKLLLIDPDSQSVTVAAKGVRNTQSLHLAQQNGETFVVFADIGGVTAEEVNAIRVADLTDTSKVENFGWGIASDGNAREGTFYVETGEARTAGTPAAIGVAEPDAPSEAEFEAPYAQFNREIPGSFVAISGVAFSQASFDLISTLSSDLVSGLLYGTSAPLGDSVVDVFDVALFDADLQETSLLDLSIQDRTDPRFFNFADGGAGVLIESTGALYRLTEIAAQAVPLPATMLMILSAFGALRGVGRLTVRAASD